MSEDLSELLGTQETASLESKESPKDRKMLGQVICAFANDLPRHGGGDLLIGVSDRGEPVDVDTGDQTLLTITDFRDDGRIIDRPSMVVEVAPFKGKPVIRVRVERSATPPVRFEGIVWVRPGPTTRKANRDDERVLAERRRVLEPLFDSRALHTATVDDLDLNLFRAQYLPSVVALEVLEETVGRSSNSSRHSVSPIRTPFPQSSVC